MSSQETMIDEGEVIVEWEDLEKLEDLLVQRKFDDAENLLSQIMEDAHS